MDCSPPDSSIHGIFQARVLEWVAISFSKESSQPRDWTRVSCIAGRHFTTWVTREYQSLSVFIYGVAQSRTRLRDWTELNWSFTYVLQYTDVNFDISESFSLRKDIWFSFMKTCLHEVWVGKQLRHWQWEPEIWNQMKSEICCVHALVTQSCPTLCDPMHCSLPSSSINGII